jgi:hypothetical protein
MNTLGLEPLTKGVSETGATLLAIVIGFGLSWLTQRHVDKHRRRREEFDRWFSEISAAAVFVLSELDAHRIMWSDHRMRCLVPASVAN